MSLQFSYGKLTFEEVREFLLETDNEFPTPLSVHVDIDAYAKKLSDFSDFSICRDGESIVGMISCYTNRPPIGYMSNVCVKSQFQGEGVFSGLFNNLLKNLEPLGIGVLRLEVDCQNEKAKSIYQHFGFLERELILDANRILMELVMN